jgi:ribosomal protein S6
VFDGMARRLNSGSVSDMILSTMYELTVIASSKIESDSAISKVEKILKDVDATVITVTRIGKKMLAYPVAKQTEGEYFAFNFEAGGEAVKKMSEALRLERETILRYLIIKGLKGKGTGESGVSKVSKGKEEKKTAKVTVKTKVIAKKQSKVAGAVTGRETRVSKAKGNVITEGTEKKKKAQKELRGK